MALPERDETGRHRGLRDRAIEIEYWMVTALVAGSLVYGIYCGLAQL